MQKSDEPVLQTDSDKIADMVNHLLFELIDKKYPVFYEHEYEVAGFVVKRCKFKEFNYISLFCGSTFSRRKFILKSFHPISEEVLDQTQEQEKHLI